MPRAQHIRPSQFITTYGPGSILEGPDGPRIVPTLDQSGVFGSDPIVTYAIPEPTLSRLLPGDARIVRLPTNAERRVKDSDFIYQTHPFPRWSLCGDHSTLYTHTINSNSSGCPFCKPHDHPAPAWAASRREAIRFVRACSAGHLDDVNWLGIVKHQRPACSPKHLRWKGAGAALTDVDIECPDCGGTMNLGAAYNRDWDCPGSSPEKRQYNQGCDAKARIIHRGAANLYMTDLTSAVTIPRMDTTLHQALASSQVLPVLSMMHDMGVLTSGATIRTQIKKLADQKVLPDAVWAEVSKYQDEPVLKAARDVLGGNLPQTPEQARLNEFRELQRAATHGHPADPSSSVGQFEVVKHRVRSITGPGGSLLRIAPVSRLRVVIAQLGYRRLDGQKGTLVDSSFAHGADRWYPGVELLGEGIFVDHVPGKSDDESQSDHPEMKGDQWKAWVDASNHTKDPHRHPVFVWWHTLAHRLVVALSVDSGYSSASIRERIFLRLDEGGAVAIGGILLYTAQPGGDGTLGGMLALVPRFERVLAAALDDLDDCSNDPLCREERFQEGRENGAICYACGLISETSCEFRNMRLDRSLLCENLP